MKYDYELKIDECGMQPPLRTKLGEVGRGNNQSGYWGLGMGCRVIHQEFFVMLPDPVEIIGLIVKTLPDRTTNKFKKHIHVVYH